MKTLHKQRGFWNFVLPAVASVVGGALANKGSKDAAEDTSNFNAAEAARNRQFNAEQAEIGRDYSAQQAANAMGFSERMSNTSYQRTIQDMKAAGLNPMLAYSQGGASTPQGVAGSSSSASGSAAQGVTPQVKDIISPAVASAQQARQVTAQLENTQANTDLQRAERDLKAQELLNKGTDQSLTIEQTRKVKQEIENLGVQNRVSETQIEKIIQDVRESNSREDLNKVELTLKKLSIEEAKVLERFFKSDTGEVSPWIKQILQVLGSIIRR